MKKQKQQLFNILMVLFVVLLPFQTRWIVYGASIEGQAWEYGLISVYGSALLLLVAAALFLTEQQREVNFSKSKFIYFVFIYSIVVCLLSLVPAVSFYHLLLLYWAGIFAYLVRFVEKKTILYSFVAGGFIQSILAMMQIFSQKVVANKWLGMAEQLPQTAGVSVVEYGSERLLRAYGALSHPNVLAGVLFVGIFSAIYLWYLLYKESEGQHWKKALVKKNVWPLVFLLVSLVVMTFGMLATFSRTGLLALSAALASVLIVGVLKKQWIRVQVVIKYVVVALVIFFMFNSWFPNAWQTRWQATGRLEEKSVEERVAGLQSFGYDNWQQVLFGQGLGMNTIESYYHDPVDIVAKVQPIHNIFVLALAEIGVIGILLVIQVLRYLFRKADNVSIMSTSLLLGLLVIGIFDHYLWTSWTGLCLLFFGLINLHKTQPIK